MKRISKDLEKMPPSSLSRAIRDRCSRCWDIGAYLRARQEFGRRSLPANVAASFDAILRPSKTILFYPDSPNRWFIAYKLCALLGYAITANPNRRFDVAFKRKDATFFDPSCLRQIRADRIINANSLDVSKTAVGEAFESVFGYSLSVNPAEYRGRMVKKSDENATHDGQVIEGPLTPTDVSPGCVYQKEIDNTSDRPGFVVDYRVPIHGDQIPLVYLKYRPAETRFANENAFVELDEPDAAFSPSNLKSLLLFARRMGVDYGELDVLRDRDQRIYVVDVNNTPVGPPNGLPKSEAKIAVERLSKSFDQLLQDFANSPIH